MIIPIYAKVSIKCQAQYYQLLTKVLNSNVTLLPLPPYSPELNPVEQLWQQIKQRFLSNTTFQDYDDVIEKPTRITEHSSTLLDPIIISDSVHYSYSDVLKVKINLNSSHLLVLCFD
jgi:hypothetical protein